MSFPSRIVRLALGAALAAACSHAAPPAASAPQPAARPAATASGNVDMSGEWSVQIVNQGALNTGMLKLSPTSDGYTGNLMLDGANRPYLVLSVRVEGIHVRIKVDMPDGDGNIEGNVRAPNVFEGNLISRGLNGRVTATRH